MCHELRSCLLILIALIGAAAPLRSQFLPLLISRDSALALMSGKYRDSLHFQRLWGKGENPDTLDGVLDAIQFAPYKLLGRAGRAELRFGSTGRLVKFIWETGPGVLLHQYSPRLQPDSATAAFVDASHFRGLLALLTNHYGFRQSGANLDTTFAHLRWPTDTLFATLTFKNPTTLGVAISYPNPLPRKSEDIFVRMDSSKSEDIFVSIDPMGRKPIIDQTANGQEQLRRGIEIAAINGKRPLLLLGAQWCARCDSLHNVMLNDSAIAGMLKRDFHLVLVNMADDNFRELNEHLGDPLRLGLPVLMTLQANGTPRNARELSAMATGERYNPTAVRALLQEWRK
ncbi:MAG: hypothetical protein DYG96_03380 [Chlorobi bacterium CHB2]|nr:hypothetical protein [Chlorobi bacterium CHB2]